MLDFLSKYGFIIIEIAISLCCLLLYVFKKHKIVLKDTPFEIILSKLPVLIKTAEEFYSKGTDKKSFVLAVCFSLLAELTGESIEVVTERYSSRLDLAIEKILETPQKK